MCVSRKALRQDSTWQRPVALCREVPASAWTNIRNHFQQRNTLDKSVRLQKGKMRRELPLRGSESRCTVSDVANRMKATVDAEGNEE